MRDKNDPRAEAVIIMLSQLDDVPDVRQLLAVADRADPLREVVASMAQVKTHKTGRPCISCPPADRYDGVVSIDSKCIYRRLAHAL